jgi:hypothetical protein
MSAAGFHEATLDLLRNYWRIKAANALYRISPNLAEDRLEYSGVPAVGGLAHHFASETVTDATSALDHFIVQRLPRELLLALIAEFEGRIGARLVSLGEPNDGTLGTLQYKIQSKVLLIPNLVDDLNEIRERRNAMIHHGDVAHAKYVAVCHAVLPRADPFVKTVVVGDNVIPNEAYLTYSADVLIRYSNAIG